MALSKGVTRKISPWTKVVNGQVKGNRQEAGENKSQPLPSLGLKDKCTGAEVDGGTTDGVGFEASSSACRDLREEVREQARQSHSSLPPIAGWHFPLSQPQWNQLEAQGLALPSIQICLRDAEQAREQREGGTLNVGYNYHFYEHSKGLLGFIS